MKKCRYSSTISLISTLHGDACLASRIGGFTVGKKKGTLPIQREGEWPRNPSGEFVSEKIAPA
jgi:hypothetical protein